MKQFGRKAQIVVETTSPLFTDKEGKSYEFYDKLVVENLRIAFEIEKGRKPYNNSRFTIYNLSNIRRENLDVFDKTATTVSLFVKYQEDPGFQLLAKTDISSVSHSFDLPNISTTLSCEDGRNVLSEPVSFAAPKKEAKMSEIIKQLEGVLNQAISAPFSLLNNESSSFLTEKTFAGGWNDTCIAKDAFEKLGDEAEGHATVVDGELQIIPDDGFEETEKKGKVISQDTGMIGFPQKMDNVLTKSGKKKKKKNGEATSAPGYEVTTLLDPSVKPGHRVKLICKRMNINSIFNVESVSHRGDTHGDIWESKIRLLFL